MDIHEIDDIETAVNQEYPAHDPNRRETLDGFDGDSSPTNGDRAETASQAIAGADIDLEDESSFADLVCGLLHMAHSLGHDVNYVMRSAIISFHAEAGPLDK
jgi:hypothetical protein